MAGRVVGNSAPQFVEIGPWADTRLHPRCPTATSGQEDRRQRVTPGPIQGALEPGGPTFGLGQRELSLGPLGRRLVRSQLPLPSSHLETPLQPELGIRNGLLPPRQ